MTRKTMPLQRRKAGGEGPPREKREHPGEPPRNTDPHPRSFAPVASRVTHIR